MATETGPSALGGKEPARKKLWPIVGGKAPRKGFSKAGKVKKPQRYQSGAVALCKTCWFQKSTELLLCKLPFSCLFHKIAQEGIKFDMCFQVCTVLTLHGAAEYYLVGLLKDANLYTIHMKCIMIMPKDKTISPSYPWRAPPLLSLSSSPKSVLVFLLIVGCARFY